MKGLFIISPGKMKILDLDQPEPGPYEALVKTEACAICNSTDTKVIRGQFVSGSWPVLLGHETVGKVVKTGSQVKNYKIGDRVLRGTLADKDIPFPGGRSCWGGFCEFTLVTDVWAKEGAGYNCWPYPQQTVPLSINPVQATLLITLKENMSVVTNFDVKDQSLAIIGTGPVAQSMALFARKLGARKVAVFGRKESHRELFIHLGVDGYSSEEMTPIWIHDTLAKGGFDRVLEAVGSRQALTQCIRLAGSNGKVGIYGIPTEEEPYAFEDLNNPRVSSPKVAEAEVHQQVLEMVEKGEINLSDWVSVSLPWEEFELGFNKIWRKEVNKVVLTFG
jgi:threonine dehydrogenase-like Zn-dependent dehydrogenase